MRELSQKKCPSLPYSRPNGRGKVLLPLNSRRWLRRNIQDYAVHAFSLIYNPTRHPSQDFFRQHYPVSSHTVARSNRTNCNRFVKRSAVTHHANTAHVEQHRKRLPIIWWQDASPRSISSITILSAPRNVLSRGSVISPDNALPNQAQEKVADP